jgi:hypothetical protein
MVWFLEFLAGIRISNPPQAADDARQELPRQ